MKNQIFSQKGQTTAYDWVQFIRSYGKYLFAQYHEDETLEHLSLMLDYTNLLLSGSITPEVMDKIYAAQRKVAAEFRRFSVTEEAIVMHNLIFHLPDYIAKWGPLRGYWCFPFERFVQDYTRARSHERLRFGLAHSELLRSELCVSLLLRWINVLARNVREAKGKPESAMMNRYVEYVCVNSEFYIPLDETSDRADDVEHRHPFLPLAKTEINSTSDRYLVHWPVLTKNTRKPEFVPPPARARPAVLIPIFGREIPDSELNRHAGSIYEAYATKQKIQIGIWTYSCKKREDGMQVHRSRASMFRIKAKNVPQFMSSLRDFEEELDDPEEYLYGRFIKFISIHVSRWTLNGVKHDYKHVCEYVGKCLLYRGEQADPVTKEVAIDLGKPLMWQLEPGVGRRQRIEYVTLRHVEGQIALGAIKTGLLKSNAFKNVRDENDQNGTNLNMPSQSNHPVQDTHRYYVIVLQK